MERAAPIDPGIASAGEALLAARDAGDLEQLADVVDRSGVDLAHTAYGEELYDIVVALPLELARNRPGLAWRFEDLGRLPVGTVPVILPRNDAEARQEAVRNGDLRLRQAVLPLNTRRREGRWDEAMAIVEGGMALAAACVYPLYGNQGSFLPYWYLQAGITTHQAGDPVGSRPHYLNAWTYRARDRYGHTARATAAGLAMLDAFLGDHTSSLEWQAAAEGEERRADLWMDWFREGLERSTDAIRGTYALVENSHDLLVPASHPSQRHGHWATFLWVHVQHALTYRDTALARRTLEEALKAPGPARGTGIARLLVPLLRAEIHLASGQGNLALVELENLDDLGGLTRSLRARTLLLTGQAHEALGETTALVLSSTACRRAVTESLLVAAAAHLTLGDRDAAVLAARGATTRVVEQNAPRLLATIPRTALDDLQVDVRELAPLLALLDARGVGDIYPASVELVAVTDREQNLLRELTADRTLAEIAAATYVSVNTVRTHLANLRKKLGASSRDEVVTRARQLGLMDD